MKKYSLFIAASCLFYMVSCDPADSSDDKNKLETDELQDEVSMDQLKVMSYNIRLETTSDGSNTWLNRRDATIEMLDDIQPDVFGVQEALSSQVQYIKNKAPEYDNVGVGRDDGVSKGEFMSIFWRKEAVEMVKWGTYWLSETPDEPSYGWDAAYRRTATWALMKDRRNGREFYFVNTHLDNKGEKARINGLQLIVDRIGEMNPDAFPMVLTGDFNVRPDDECLVNLDKQMTSTRKIAEITDNKTTCNGWGKHSEDSGYVIDYIYVSGFKSVPEYRTITTKYADKPYISDHYPIMSVLEY